MSAESLRARLEAATVDKLQMGNYDDPVLQPADVDFLEHVRTDLRLALDVIEALRAIINGERDGRLSPTSPIWADARAALDAFEAAP